MSQTWRLSSITFNALLYSLKLMCLVERITCFTSRNIKRPSRGFPYAVFEVILIIYKFNALPISIFSSKSGTCYTFFSIIVQPTSVCLQTSPIPTIFE